jgi:hypothetical protein
MTHLNNHCFCSASTLQDALSWYTYDVANIISTTTIAKRKVDYDDRGAFGIIQELMHSWVGYELVTVLLIFGLTPKIRKDVKDWSLDLFHLFSYLGDKQRDPSKKEQADHLLTILFDKTLHNRYFRNCHLEARTNLQKRPILHYHWLY